MWKGVLPAVTTKFAEDGSLDHDEMLRCFGIQIDAGVDGLIACGSLGEGPMLSHDERIAVLRLCKEAAGAKPALLTVAEAATKDACDVGTPSSPGTGDCGGGATNMGCISCAEKGSCAAALQACTSNPDCTSYANALSSCRS